MEKIVFVGAGSMAEALIAGMLAKGTAKPQNIHVMNKSDDDRLIFMEETYLVQTGNNEAALHSADLIVLSTKPKDIRMAMNSIKGCIRPKTAVLSVVAGLTIGDIEAAMGSRPVARSMPNTSAMIGKSATGISFNREVTVEVKERISSILSSIGMLKEVDEDDLHAVTALSGSGPAYIYYLAEALEEAAVSRGLAKETARDLIIQTLEGASAMLKLSAEEPASLRAKVTSEGGTTEAGLSALKENGFKEAIQCCIEHAEKRSRELGDAPVIS